jgi:ElaB/YqjD/DUF883 family membrane-anchored ribosome-binding protein
MAETTGARQARIKSSETKGSENDSSTRETISNLGENLKAKASDMGQRVSDMGQRVNEAIDDQRNAAADRLDDAASSLHEGARHIPGGGRMSDMAHRAAGTLEQTSQYIREHDTSAMASDAADFVKRYPTQAIVAAAIGGFLIGRLFRRG